MTKIQLAKTAGFCFGVNRAVNMVWKLAGEGKRVCTLGPIIHNQNMVRELEQNGVRIVNSPDEVETGETMVIRSHGVGKNIYDEIAALGVDYVDATCPFVSKIHKTVKKRSEAGDVVLIVGDKNHPEVIGIQNHCVGENYTVKSPEEIEKLSQDNPELKNKSVSVVCQTTFDIKLWEKCSETIKKVYTNSIFLIQYVVLRLIGRLRRSSCQKVRILWLSSETKTARIPVSFITSARAFAKTQCWRKPRMIFCLRW